MSSIEVAAPPVPPGVEGLAAVVVGASSGIGRETAVQLARRGAKVLAVARRQARLQQLSAEAGVDYLVGSIDDDTSCRAIVAGAEERLGRVDVFVNVAAIGAAHESAVQEEALVEWRRSIRLNLEAPFVLLQFVVRGMIERGFGRVVFVSSTASEHGGARMPAYCASKHGLLGLVRAAAIDLAPHGITCNAVAPGWVRTEMSQRLVEKMARLRDSDVETVWAEIDASYPGGRAATVHEVAHAIVALADGGASGISGQNVTVAGGGVW